jgi:hypothetical protein
VLLSQSASPSVVCLSSPRSTYLGFLTEGKLAAILITPFSWGSQLDAIKRSRNSNKRFKKKTHVLYNETQVGLSQSINNSNIHECKNYGLIQTNYVLDIDVLRRGLSGKS